MERWVGRVAIVTGASAGIGYQIAETLVRHGMIVVGCARNVESIQTLSSSLSQERGQLTAVRCDVTKEADVIAVFEEAVRRHGRVDVCINNAGLAHCAPLLSGETEQWRNVLEVNVLAVAVFTREAVKYMKQSGVDDGHIINVNSVAGHKVDGAPNGNFYAATKFAVTALTEGTRAELRAARSNIRISQISPGLVATEFLQRKRQISAQEAREVYATCNHMAADDVADAIVYMLSTPENVQVHDLILTHTQEYIP